MSQRNPPILAGIDGSVTEHSDVGATTSAILLNNWTAVVAPVVTDDADSGYVVGSEWTDVTADKSYKLIDATVGAAVWKETTAAGGTTNLGATANGTSLTVTSSTGTNATIPAATTSAWGAMTDEDKTKLDGIEASADVTDTANVASAGALMDSELTDLAGVKAVTISTLQPKPSEGAFANGDKTKLDGISVGADKYYSQNLIDTTGGTIDAPYGTPAILTSSANFYITVVETGTYIIHGSVNTDNDLNKDNNALELVYGIDTGSGAAIGPVPYQQNLQGKKNKRNGIQGTWLGVSLTAGDKVHMYMSTCDDSCTWLGGRIFIAQWK
jgi:hypothetical protein